MIVFFILMPITIIGILLYLSYLTFQLLVEVIKLKKLRKDVESEKTKILKDTQCKACGK